MIQPTENPNADYAPIFDRDTLDFTSPEYKEFEERISKIKGFFGNEEGYALREFVSRIPFIDKDFVEIGSYMGKSTTCLLEGFNSAKGSGRPTYTNVIAIDHFKGSEEHQVGQSHEVEELMKFGSTFMNFRQNTQHCENLIPIAASSEDVACFWNKPIQFLFIDGDHSYDGVRRDFENFEPHVVSGGYIAIHDVEYTNKKGELVNKFPGVNDFYNSLSLCKYDEVFDIGSSLRILRKR